MLLFENRRLVIATMHHKESVIAPLLEKELAVNCFVPDNFNTDNLGTFSGEIERKDDPLTTARKKCLMAMELTNCDLGVANEGSFGSHPSVFIASADDEILILIDKKNNLEIVVRELSLETNFNAVKISTYSELEEFANTVQFPSHAILLKSTKNETPVIVKGIQSWELLKESYEKLYNNTTPIDAETDMRALFNPTRMKVIKKATHKLIEKIKSLCPKCKTPGFGIVSAKSGLLCEYCKSETKSIKSYVYQCQKCQYELEKMFPNNKQFEDPMYCDYCNP
jgi:hypothetical protein